MHDSKYLQPALIALGIYFAFKLGKGAPELAQVPEDCVGENSDASILNIAQTIKTVFVNEYFYWDEDEAKIIAAFKQIKDSCSYRKVFSVFGVYNSYTRGDGNLDYWMGKLSDSAKDKCRPFAYGLAGF